MLLQAFVLVQVERMVGCKEKVSNPDARLKACFHPPQWPRRSLLQGTWGEVARDDRAKPYTWSAVKCPPTVSRLCPCYVTAPPPLFTGNPTKVSHDGSRALGRAAGVELSSRASVAPPAGTALCRGQVGAGAGTLPSTLSAFLPPTNRMSQTDTRTLGPEKGLGKV